LSLRSEVAEELEHSGATASNDSEAEDGDEKEMFTWKEELLNHSINEGSLPYTDAGSSSEVDYSAKMELHSHHRYSISGKCIQSTTWGKASKACKSRIDEYRGATGVLLTMRAAKLCKDRVQSAYDPSTHWNKQPGRFLTVGYHLSLVERFTVKV
jgi:hypothetical protein